MLAVMICTLVCLCVCDGAAMIFNQCYVDLCVCLRGCWGRVVEYELGSQGLYCSSNRPIFGDIFQRLNSLTNQYFLGGYLLYIYIYVYIYWHTVYTRYIHTYLPNHTIPYHTIPLHYITLHSIHYILYIICPGMRFTWTSHMVGSSQMFTSWKTPAPGTPPGDPRKTTCRASPRTSRRETDGSRDGSHQWLLVGGLEHENGGLMVDSMGFDGDMIG